MGEDSVAPTIYHPWRELGRIWPHVAVEHTDELPDGLLGETDGHSLIRLRRRQLQVERRCTLAHEMIHLERGHRGHCNDRIERAIEREAARRLITLPQLLAAVRWTVHPDELADELWVTDDILRARAETLTGPDLLAIADAIQDARRRPHHHMHHHWGRRHHADDGPHPCGDLHAPVHLPGGVHLPRAAGDRVP